MIDLTFDNDIAHIHFDDGKANVLNSGSLSALEQALEQSKAAKAVVLSGREGRSAEGSTSRRSRPYRSKNFEQPWGSSPLCVAPC